MERVAQMGIYIIEFIGYLSFYSVMIFRILLKYFSQPPEKWIASKVRGWADEEESEKKGDAIPVCCDLSKRLYHSPE